MARDHRWDDERFYSSSNDDSSESPVLSYRYEKRHFAPYVRESRPDDKEKRSTFSILAKFFFFSSAMIMFCVFLYIPVYIRVNDQLPKGAVAGWSIHTNRDTKIYVRPNNVTTLHQPKNVCQSNNREKNNLFLLIIVCSSTTNFDRRLAIRNTWGNYKKYKNISSIFNSVRDKYKHYNYTYDLYNKSIDLKYNVSTKRVKRDISSFGQLLPELAKALKSNLYNVKTDEVPEEKRFDDENDEDDKMLPQFDMNKELGDENNVEGNYDYYDTNVMKIPPKGYEESPDLSRILSMLRKAKTFPEIEEKVEESNIEPDFKLVFLLGLPSQSNETVVQSKIVDEIEKYGDVIQEDFIDSYNNLTLKSIMMLKWVTNNCKDSVRYILKIDDDMYLNVPNLIQNLRNRSKEHDDRVANGHKGEEYLLIGDLICGARPVQDSSNKWFSPRYMYGGRVYPRYLSGTGYVFSAPTAHALYRAALITHYFHLEDIYITGMCSMRATPRVVPRDDGGFSYQRGQACDVCCAHAHVTVHRVPADRMRTLHERMQHLAEVDKCERLRLTQIKESDYRSHVLYKYISLLITSKC